MGDLDSDGRADLVVGGLDVTGTSGEVSGLISAGLPGSFASPQQLTIGDRLVSASLGDLDNDKDLDLVLADGGANDVLVLDNLGGLIWLGFALDQSIPVGNGVVQASLGDLDNDKDLDLLTTNSIDGTVSISFNTGGALSTATSIPVGTRPISLALADLDQDTDRDIAVVVDDESQPGERLVRVLRNDLDAPGGQVILANALDLPSNLRPAIALSEAATLLPGVVTRDLDGDGDDDVVTVNENPPSARSGALASAEVLLQGALSIPADLNTDGVVDSSDLAILLAAWGTPGADLNGDGITNSNDLAILLAAWGS